jgi:hypothetical protein
VAQADDLARTSKTFRFEATVTDPATLSADKQEELRRRFEQASVTDLRLREDTEGRTTLSFPVDAPNPGAALDKGREMTQSALAGHPVAWFVGGITHWVNE